MDKCQDKFCPDCGHHLYLNVRAYWCADCETWCDPQDTLALEQAQPLRVGYDASARKAVQQ